MNNSASLPTESSVNVDPPIHADSRPRGLSDDWASAAVGVFVTLLGLAICLQSKPPQLEWFRGVASPPSAPQAPVASGNVSSSVVGESALPSDETEPAEAEPAKAKVEKPKWTSPAAGWIGNVAEWNLNPLTALVDPKTEKSLLPGLLGALFVTGAVGSLALLLQRQSLGPFLKAFPVVFLLAFMAFLMSTEQVIASSNLEYALWALLVGMVICNTIGTPAWLKPAVRGELFIKLGLVLYGSEVLFGRLLALGVPGIFVSWVVTPVVLVSTYVFGQRFLKMESKSLNIVISADMSVCGVSAAIATAAACKAKKEELSLAIGLSLSFTVLMMIVMPRVVNFLDLDPRIGGAWIGGTIDSTGAVAAAGKALGEVGEQTAITVKMIQNILIGVVALCVAVYWTKWVDTSSRNQIEVGVGEIWIRFPKFVLGFLGISILCSALFAASLFGELWVNAVVSSVTKPLRNWLFCLAFVCLGLDTNFRQLLPYFRTGKPTSLYLCGQALNILLTFLMAYLMYGVIFKE
jgi:uncharacterized integral membrane protein (TIGR00698 family)